MRPGFGSAAELPALSPVRRRHVGCSSPLGAAHVIGGNRRAAPASARGTGRTAYTQDVGRTYWCKLRERPFEVQRGERRTQRERAIPYIVSVGFGTPAAQSRQLAPHVRGVPCTM
ncbi:MAG TPA: hypothetical protein VJV21_08000 [Pyrinomonadaceae bacterium]|nr:hypothetical protein [Pyrinomonadaceae bacterium]